MEVAFGWRHSLPGCFLSELGEEEGRAEEVGWGLEEGSGRGTWRWKPGAGAGPKMEA